MANPGMIGGGRLTRMETSGDRRSLSGLKQSKGALLARFWRYLGRNRLLLALAVTLSVTSNILSLLGPKLSGEAINLIERGVGNIDLAGVTKLVLWMCCFYGASALMSYGLSRVMIRLSRRVVQQMRHDVFEKLVQLPVGFSTDSRRAIFSASLPMISTP